MGNADTRPSVGGVQLADDEVFYAKARPTKQLQREAQDRRKGVPAELLQDQELGVALRLELMQVLVRSTPVVDLPIVDGAIETIPIIGCPSPAVRLLEYQRGLTSPGNIFVSVPYTKHLFAVYSKDGIPLGSVALSEPPNETGDRLQFQSHADAIEVFDMGQIRPVSEEELELYLRRYPDFFKPGSEFSQKTGFDDLPVLIPLETGLQCMQLLDACGDSQMHKDTLFSFLRKFGQTGLLALLGLDLQADVPKQIDRLYDFSTSSFGHANDLIQKYAEVIIDAEPVEHQFTNKDAAKPITGRITQMANAIMQVTLEDYAKTDFNWKLAYVSFEALQDILSSIYRLPVPFNEKDVTFRGSLLDYAQEYANDPKRLALILPILELSWLERLQEYMPGDFQRQSTEFYARMGKHLHETASETTGDTKLELARLQSIFDWLITTKRWERGDHLMDVGSADGERIFRPLLRSPQLQSIPPAAAYAVDRDSYPQPADNAWVQLRKDFIDEDFSAIVDKPVDVITHTWSPINDLDGPDQKRALDNFNATLRPGGILILDIPGGYLEEMIEYKRLHGTRSLGKISKKFLLADGAQVEKEFLIGEQYDIVSRVTMAGFRIMNLPDDANPINGVPAFYNTQSGNRRVTLVLEKIGETTPTLDQIALSFRQRPS